MALDSARLKTAIHDKILTLMGVSATNDTWLNEFCQAIAEAVITEVTGHATVNGGTVSGTVTSGSGSGGSVTGTLSNATIT